MIKLGEDPAGRVTEDQGTERPGEARGVTVKKTTVEEQRGGVGRKRGGNHMKEEEVITQRRRGGIPRIQRRREIGVMTTVRGKRGSMVGPTEGRTMRRNQGIIQRQILGKSTRGGTAVMKSKNMNTGERAVWTGVIKEGEGSDASEKQLSVSYHKQ